MIFNSDILAFREPGLAQALAKLSGKAVAPSAPLALMSVTTGMFAAGCCARAGSTSPTAAPTILMNSRRLIDRPLRLLHSRTKLRRAGCVVHHNKVPGGMFAWVKSCRAVWRRPCPLYPQKRTRPRVGSVSAMGQKRTCCLIQLAHRQRDVRIGS